MYVVLLYIPSNNAVV